jgi:hypothetical protein
MLKNKIVLATLTSCTLLLNMITIKTSVVSANSPSQASTITVKQKQNKLDEFPNSVVNKIAQATRSDYAGGLKKIVKFERVPYPYYCDEIREGKKQPLTCDPPNIKDTWKATVDTYFERLVYYVRDGGKTKLASREYLAKSNKAPSRVQQAVLQDAQKNWGLPKNTLKIVSVRETLQPSGADFTALPVEPRFDGQVSKARFWEIIIEQNQTQWIYYVDKNNPNKLQLWSRLNYAKQAKLPVDVALELISRASTNFNLTNGQALITNVEETKYDSCLGLAAPWETCQNASLSGYHVTMQAQNNTQVVYRIARENKYIAMEGTQNMPPRNDILSNTLAEKILKDASSRLKTSTINLRISSIENSRECISANPEVNRKCQVKVYVRNGQQELAYTLDRNRQNFSKVQARK